MARFKWAFRDAGLVLIEKDGVSIAPELKPDVHAVHQDSMDALTNHSDGKVYDSKSSFRRATKAAGCYEVGEKVVRPPKEIDKKKRKELLKDVVEVMSEKGTLQGKLLFETQRLERLGTNERVIRDERERIRAEYKEKYGNER